MCQYLDLTKGRCRISKDICPYAYFCNKKNVYKELKSMPIDCKVKEQVQAPEGFYKVCFEKHGKLYILVGNNIEIVPNTYDHTPLYVKMTRLKSGKWKIRKVMG